MKHYLIDSENVGDFWIPLLDLPADQAELIVFYTKNSPHMSYDSLIKLKESDRDVIFIKCYEGTNALDFQLCSELGFRIAGNEEDEFIIVTNDTGYDAAVKYWRHKEYSVKRIAGKDSRTGSRRRGNLARTDVAAEVSAILHKLVRTQDPDDSRQKGTGEQDDLNTRLPESDSDVTAKSEFETDSYYDDPEENREDEFEEDGSEEFVTEEEDTEDHDSQDYDSEDYDSDDDFEEEDPDAADPDHADSEDTDSQDPDDDETDSEDMESEDIDSEDMGSEDMDSEDMDSEDMDSEETDSKETDSEDAGSDEPESDDDENSYDTDQADTDSEEEADPYDDGEPDLIGSGAAVKSFEDDPAENFSEESLEEPVNDSGEEAVPEDHFTPDAEEITAIVNCIGMDNLAELHNQLIQFYGENGKEIYQSIKSGALTIEKQNWDREEKFLYYCALIFRHSDEPEEALEEENIREFSQFILGAENKRKNLNSLRYALLKHYGKEKGRRYYFMLKPYVKALNQM